MSSKSKACLTGLFIGESWGEESFVLSTALGICCLLSAKGFSCTCNLNTVTCGSHSLPPTTMSKIVRLDSLCAVQQGHALCGHLLRTVAIGVRNANHSAITSSEPGGSRHCSCPSLPPLRASEWTPVLGWHSREICSRVDNLIKLAVNWSQITVRIGKWRSYTLTDRVNWHNFHWGQFGNNYQNYKPSQAGVA